MYILIPYITLYIIFLFLFIKEHTTKVYFKLCHLYYSDMIFKQIWNSKERYGWEFKRITERTYSNCNSVLNLIIIKNIAFEIPILSEARSYYSWLNINSDKLL